MNRDDAIKKVFSFLDSKEYTGERLILQIVKRNDYWNVMLLKPHGLFIIKPDGSIQDNYEVFK